MSVVEKPNGEKPKAKAKPSSPKKAFSKETVEQMKKDIPSALETIFDLPEGEGKNIYDLFTIILGAQNKDVMSVIERTELTEEEIPIMCDLYIQAEHGIGLDGLDFPQPLVGERLVMELRARRSKNRMSSQEFATITTGWLESLKKREAEAEKRSKSENKFVGAN